MPSLLLPLALALLPLTHALIPNFPTLVSTHGTIGCLAWAILFPLGAIALRVLHHPKTWLVHAAIQLLAYSLVVVNTGLGIWIGMSTQQLNNYHARIGLTLFALITLQPLTGALHHYLFATKHKPNTALTQTHIWLGRVLITLGMINGGLGMLFGGTVFRNAPNRAQQIAYGVVAGVVWVGWIGVVVFVGVKGSGRVAGTRKGAENEI